MAGSPDSSISISSLLASCSLGSSKGSSSSSRSIEYKNKLYDSATKALEAYIDDHEETLQSSMASTGKITIHSPAKKKGVADTNVRPKHSSRRRCIARDPDLLSLTTDDLLGFPSDGSLRFSQVLDQKHCKNLNNHYGHSLPYHSTRSSPLMSSLKTRTNLHSLHHNSQSLDLRNLEDDLKENRTNSLLGMGRENHPAYCNNLNSPYLLRGSEGHKSYPRWLTSQKSELGVSGITSIPEVGYPIWIKDYGLLGNANSHRTRNIENSLKAPVAHEPVRNLHGYSSLGSLHPLFYDRHGKEMVNSGSGGGKFYSGLSDLDVLKHLHTPLKNRPNDLPLRKSEAIESSQKVLPELPENNGSPRTEDVLEAERSWEKIPYSFKSPVPIPIKDEIGEGSAATLTSHLGEDLLEHKVKEDNASSFSGGNHHGPVEALKHMLFNLQAFQQNYTQDQSYEKVEEFQKVYTEAESELERVDQEVFPVNKSLQKALQHLARLKELVGDGTTKQDQENNEEV
ncbi:PREDICTED: lung adenoma susceptibility protein 2 [Nanorana parkeri]|uniref:lung adenoma susceptibility protein 2 n=1 Tax=Nanorana parkeri TaxID=125878 RepID=UPI000854A8F0|nr:PREDICTED: lung adenoma susceptibility protein 2 [Nanorana parkeri]